MDDVWSDVIDLPFNFCFFEGIHDNIQVGSNGNMTFKEKSTGPDQNSFQLINGTEYLTLPNTEFSMAEVNIFGVFHDLILLLMLIKRMGLI